jgi:hypothetical protein
VPGRDDEGISSAAAATLQRFAHNRRHLGGELGVVRPAAAHLGDRTSPSTFTYAFISNTFETALDACSE